MLKSYNGWTASKNPADFGGIVPLVWAGESFSPGVRAGVVHDLFVELVSRLHTRVEPVVKADWHQADDWGWYFKASANSAALLSCHSSATAIDYNATRHPNGKRGTYNAAQVKEIRVVQAELGGLVYWGGDAWGDGTPDEMHWEVKTGVTEAQIVAQLARMRGTKLAQPVVGRILECFNRVGGLALLGQPKGPEVATSGSDPVGRWQQFERGRVLWHPAIGTAHEIHGDIEALWTRIGFEKGFGWPTTDEQVCPDALGRFQHYTLAGQDRSIYWHPKTGAQPIVGAIRGTWASHGWERSALGYPVAAEVKTATGWSQRFQGGVINWDGNRASIA